MRGPVITLLAAATACVALLGAPPAAQAAEGPLVGAWTNTAPMTGNPAMPPMPTPRANVAAVVAFDHLIVIGGQTGPGTDTIVGTVEAYRTASAGQTPKNVWIGDTSTGGVNQPMPAPRAGATAAVVPDPYDNSKRYIYVIGGIGPDVFDEDGDGDTTEIISSHAVQVYDFVAHTWTTNKAPKLTPGWGAALVKVPEPFTDLNNDGEWNIGEKFTDTNGNGTWDADLHILNGVCTVSPTECGFPSNQVYEIYSPGRRDNPATSGTNEFIPDAWNAASVPSPPPEREPAGVLTTSLDPRDTSPRYIYKLGGGTGGVVATAGALRRDVDGGGNWEELKSMPQARTGHVAISLRGVTSAGYAMQYPAVFGGSVDGVTPSSAIMVYEPDLKGWIVDSRMTDADGTTSHPRTGRFALGVVADNVYVAGGFTTDGAVDGTILRAPLNKSNTPVAPPVDAPLVGNWENVQQLIPTPRTRSAFAQVGSKLYIFGGEDGSRGSVWGDSLSDDVEVYDMQTNSWTTSDASKGTKTETPMPVNFSRGVAALLTDGQGKQKIYIAGGFVDANKNDVFGDDADAFPSAAMYIYDPDTKTWSTGPAMPTARQYPGHFVYQNKLHVVGGALANGDPAGSPHEVFDPVTNTWTTDPSGTPFGGRASGAMTVVDHGSAGVFAYWLGGATKTTQLAQCARLNLTDPNAQWAQIPNIPVGGVTGAKAITVSDGADEYPTVFGGDFQSLATTKVFHYISPEYADPAKQNTWVPDAPMELTGEGKVVRSNFAIGVWNGFVYVAGGDAFNGDLVNRTLRAQLLSTYIAQVSGIGEAKAQRDGVAVNITTEKIVTLKPTTESGFIYIEDADRSSGIRVVSSDPLPETGTTVKVSGRIGTLPSGERAIMGATVSPQGAGSVAPVVMGSRDTGGPGFNQGGGAYNNGLNTEGLLVQVYGKITRFAFGPDTNFEPVLWLDDGTGVDPENPDGSLGLKVTRTEQYSGPSGYVAVTGVVTSEILQDGTRIRVIRSRDATVPSDFIQLD